jgi:hypothetical protein
MQLAYLGLAYAMLEKNWKLMESFLRQREPEKETSFLFPRQFYQIRLRVKMCVIFLITKVNSDGDLPIFFSVNFSQAI